MYLHVDTRSDVLFLLLSLISADRKQFRIYKAKSNSTRLQGSEHKEAHIRIYNIVQPIGYIV